MTALLWQTTYPTLEALGLANFETLVSWEENLPLPQTDVERTIHRRLKAMIEEHLRTQLREVSPELADKMNDVIDRMEALGIKSPVARFK
jgi:hypothetical protein